MEFEFFIAKDHPCLPGHFPGDPIVPGVVILDEILQAIKNKNFNIKVRGFSSVKFSATLSPEQKVKVRFDDNKKGVNFECSTATTIIASGTIVMDGM